MIQNKHKMCRWSWNHEWTKWEDFDMNFTNKLGQPIMIQERRCQACNKAERIIVLCREP